MEDTQAKARSNKRLHNGKPQTQEAQELPRKKHRGPRSKAAMERRNAAYEKRLQHKRESPKVDRTADEEQRPADAFEGGREGKEEEDCIISEEMHVYKLTERIKELENENKGLRTFIRRELRCDVVFLPRPSEINLPMTSDGQVDPSVLQQEGWQRPTTDTIYVWDETNGEREGMVAFAVFFQPEELMVGVNDLLKIFNLGPEYRYPLNRKSKLFKEKGRCYGVGLRPGYEKGQSYGIYKVPTKHGVPGAERASQRGNRILQNLSETIANLLESTVRHHLPFEYHEKVTLVYKERVPTLKGTKTVPHILITIDYCVNDHVDSDTPGCAYGVWLEEHNRRCKQSPTCCASWAFLLPEYRVAIPLSHGTFIAWQSATVKHCTVLEKGDACTGHQAFSVVTQIKKSLLTRVRASRRRKD